MKKPILSIFLLLSSILAHGSEKETESHFTYHDWEITCDNTHTCRMAGYSPRNEDSISVYFERKAGKNEQFLGRLRIEDYDTEKYFENPKIGELFLNSQSLGKVDFNKHGISELNDYQINKIISNAKKNNKIEIKIEQRKWSISDRGLAAVLLKMQEYQNNKVSISPPELHYQKVTEFKEFPLTAEQKNGFLTKLNEMFSDESSTDLGYCNDISEVYSVHQISSDKLVITTECALFAYNSNSLIIITDNDLNIQYINSEMNGLDYDPESQMLFGSLHHKIRGVGDCWFSSFTVWNGKVFVDAAINHTGMCRSFAGGAWQFPTYITDVINKNTKLNKAFNALDNGFYQ